MRFAVLALAFGAVLAVGSAAGQTTSMVPLYDHIVIVVEENHDYAEIIGSGAAPYINALASSGALLTNYHAVAHPSEPNYFALYAGSTFGVADDNFHSEHGPSLFTILRNSGLEFVGYVDPGATDMNHEPWKYFPEGISVEKNFITGFPHHDFSKLPKVSFVIPNLNNDMHDGPIAKGDRWLEVHLGAYAQWAGSNNSLLIVTFDENDGRPGNHTAAVLYGGHIAPATADGHRYSHYNLLSTVLAAANLTGPRRAATAGHFQVFQP